MKKNNLFIISNGSMSHKILSCVVAFFILISSICVCDFKSNISLVESAKVSASTILVQFFYISTLPVNIISKLFVDANSPAPVSKTNNDSNKNSKEENSSKASFGYSILPNTLTTSQIVKVKIIKVFTLLDKVKKSRVVACFGDCKFVCTESFFSFLFVMMLLLAILLTRRNVGNDNIIIKIENNKIAQLI